MKIANKIILFGLIAFVSLQINLLHAQEYKYRYSNNFNFTYYDSLDEVCMSFRGFRDDPASRYSNVRGGTCGEPSVTGVYEGFSLCSCFVDFTSNPGATTKELEYENLVYRIKLPPVEDEPEKPDGCPGPIGAGNPCNVATGNKFQSETDFSFGGMAFTRSYNSSNLADLGLGKGWRHNLQQKLIISGNELTQVSGTGRGEPWSKQGSSWQGDADSKVTIVEIASEFLLTKPNGASESYNVSGQINSTTDTNGHQTTYVYNGNGALTQVTNHYGQSITFSYNGDGKLNTATDSLGNQYLYEFDSRDNLVSVIYPDETSSASTDNPRKTYHYENTQYPNHLTGITDENGDRFATWSYDLYGKAISSEHAQTSNGIGQEKIELDYQGIN